MINTYLTKLPNGMSCDIAAAAEMGLKADDYVIVKRDYSLEYVRVVRMTGEDVPAEQTSLLPQAQRIATVIDRAAATENEAHAKSAYRTACQMVEKMALPMKLLNASYSFDRKLVTIQFTADGRVDFRELVKELSQALSCRLDLRQIGVRDETSICGGIAVCGQVLCCSRFLREFNSINVKMAKDQDLSLTPSTISGVCGRLKCCLKFEHDGYVEMEKSMPRRGELCECSKGRGRVSDRNMLTQMVTLQLEEGGSVTLHASELKYRLRGKAPEPKKVEEVADSSFDMPIFPNGNIHAIATVKEVATAKESAAEREDSAAEKTPGKNNEKRNQHKNRKNRNHKRKNQRRNQDGNNRRGDSED